jgi:hypothetical protein
VSKAEITFHVKATQVTALFNVKIPLEMMPTEKKIGIIELFCEERE